MEICSVGCRAVLRKIQNLINFLSFRCVFVRAWRKTIVRERAWKVEDKASIKSLRILVSFADFSHVLSSSLVHFPAHIFPWMTSCMRKKLQQHYRANTLFSLSLLRSEWRFARCSFNLLNYLARSFINYSFLSMKLNLKRRKRKNICRLFLVQKQANLEHLSSLLLLLAHPKAAGGNYEN